MMAYKQTKSAKQSKGTDKSKRKKRKNKRKTVAAGGVRQSSNVNLNVNVVGQYNAVKRRGLVPKTTSIKGQRGLGNLSAASRQNLAANNVMQGIYSALTLAALQERRIGELSSNVATLQKQMPNQSNNTSSAARDLDPHVKPR